jgi:hypothetical protein
MKHVVKFSMGITSAVAAYYVIQEHGKEDTILLFHDTKEEADDCYRFGREVASYLGMPITERSDGRSVSQLFVDEGFLGNHRITPCSRKLKQEQGNRYIEELLASGHDVTAYEGMALPDDAQRLPGRRDAHDRLGIAVRFPLIEQGLGKEDCRRIVTECWGIRLSSSYEHFDHDNCLNRGCVKGGLAYWGLLYLYRREVWEKAAAEEDSFPGQTIMSPSRYGDYPACTLRNLVERSVTAARKWEAKRGTGGQLPLLVAPCVCAA